MHRQIITPELHNLRNEFVSNGFDIRLVGGCVRDITAGHTPKDVDLCTDADPQEQIQIYNQAGIRFAETGIDHGTITVVLNGEPYEVTSLRLDVATDGRRATVAYTRDWIADLERRDLTINAMSMTFDGELVDPFNGAEDLRTGNIQFVGNAEQRIQEDYLRILRWFRFQARFGNKFSVADLWDSPAYSAIKKHKRGLEQISAERVWSEVKAILKHDRGPWMLHAMSRSGIHEHIKMPHHFTANGSDGYWAMQGAKDWTSSPEVLMAAWMGWLDGPIAKLAEDWRWSSHERNHVNWFLKHFWTNADLRKLIALENSPREWVRELAHAEDRDEWEANALVEWVFPPFPVSGHDLMAIGIEKGPKIGKTIAALKNIWADGGYVATKEELLTIVPNV